MDEFLIRRLKEIGVVCKTDVELKHAGSSGIYFNIKKAYGYPELLQLICSALWEQIDKNLTCLATTGYGGNSPATLLSADHYKYLTLIREAPKEYGLQGLIEGYMPTKQDSVAIIDDVCTTGKTMEKAIEVVYATGAKVLGCYVIVQRGEAKLSVPLHYLLTAEDLLR